MASSEALAFLISTGTFIVAVCPFLCPKTLIFYYAIFTPDRHENVWIYMKFHASGRIVENLSISGFSGILEVFMEIHETGRIPPIPNFIYLHFSFISNGLRGRPYGLRRFHAASYGLTELGAHNTPQYLKIISRIAGFRKGEVQISVILSVRQKQRPPKQRFRRPWVLTRIRSRSQAPDHSGDSFASSFR